MNRLIFRRDWRGVIFSVIACAALVSGFVLSFPVSAEDDPDDIKDDIEKYEKKLKEATRKKELLEQNLSHVNASLGAAVAAIRKTQAAILDTTDSITRAELEIELTNQQIALKQEVLADLLREAYLDGSRPSAELFLGDRTLSQQTDVSDSFATIGSRIGGILDDMEALRGAREEERSAFEAMKKETEAALAKKNAERASLSQNQAAIAEDVAEQSATIEQLREKLNDLRNDLNTLLGESYDAKNIKDAIEFASDKTGIREGFLFGMLSVESRLGASVGGCDYKQSRMSAYRLEIFKEIAKEIGKDYKKLKVSCPPKSYKGTGGAMGAAQFMSDTWKGYKSTIASRTGHNPPNPWNLTDGVMAMASKLANDGGAKKGSTTITSPCTKKKVSVKWEVYASMKYLGWSCYALNNYSKTIQSLSGNYKSL